MRIGKALLAGVVGGAVMSLAAWIARATLGIEIDIAMMLGTLFGAPPVPSTWVLGFLAHLATSGVIAMVYALAFEYVTHRAGWLRGALFAIVHALLAGAALTLIPAVHALIPERVPAPGVFWMEGGAPYVVAFFSFHLLYGTVVGAVYGPVATTPRVPERVRVREVGRASNA